MIVVLVVSIITNVKNPIGVTAAGIGYCLIILCLFVTSKHPEQVNLFVYVSLSL